MALVLALALFAIVYAAPFRIDHIDADDVQLAKDARFFKKTFRKAKKSVKKATKSVSKATKKATKGVSKATKQVGKGVKNAATTVGDGVKDAATTVGDGVKDAASAAGDVLKGASKAVKNTASKVEKALDRACKKAGTSKACKDIGKFTTQRVSQVVDQVKETSADLKAMAEGDILRGIDIFVDLAPLAFPVGVLPRILGFDIVEIIEQFLECGKLFITKGGSQLVKATREADKLKPIMEDVMFCAKTKSTANILLTLATNKKGVKNVGQQLVECVNRIARTANDLGYDTITIGATGGAGVGVGAESEVGVAFDTKSNPRAVRGYLTTGKTVGIFASVGFNVVIGFVKKPNNRLGGSGKGISLGGGPAAIGLDFDGNALEGISFSAGVPGLTEGRLPAEATCTTSTTVQF